MNLAPAPTTTNKALGNEKRSIFATLAVPTAAITIPAHPKRDGTRVSIVLDTVGNIEVLQSLYRRMELIMHSRFYYEALE